MRSFFIPGGPFFPKTLLNTHSIHKCSSLSRGGILQEPNIIPMQRPSQLHTLIYLDGSNLSETAQMMKELGFVDGQTTNPSNFVSAVKAERNQETIQFTQEELIATYKARVQELSKALPNGSISVEVYSDQDTSAQEMIAQGTEMYSWIPNAHIKLPITPAGLEAAEHFVSHGMRVNMTLCFTQEQAAAVFAATKGAKRGDVYISPFIGRVNDAGRNGMDIVSNMLRMYKQADDHVMVLAASIRTADQLAEAVAVGADITTSYLKAILDWGSQGLAVKDSASYTHPDLTPIPYEELDLTKDWRSYDISHPMTDDGLKRFAADWNALISHT